MKKQLKKYYTHLKQHQTEKKWMFPLAIGSIVSLFLLFIGTLTCSDGTPVIPLYRYAAFTDDSLFIESKLHLAPVSTSPPPPRLAYFISGSVGDGVMLRRTLLALYHPYNKYVVHLEAEAEEKERSDLFKFVEEYSLFRRFRNVIVMRKPNLVTYRGPTMVANTLHAAALLLKEGGEWDWFINLSSSDYPLVTQDGELLNNLYFLWLLILFLLCLLYIEFCFMHRSASYIFLLAAGFEFY